MHDNKSRIQFLGAERDRAWLRHARGSRDPRLTENLSAKVQTDAQEPGTSTGNRADFLSIVFTALLKWVGVNQATFEDDLRWFEIKVLEALAVNTFISTERSMALIGRAGDAPANGAYYQATLRLLAHRCRVVAVDADCEQDHNAASAWMTHLYQEGRWAAVAWYPGKRNAAAVAAALHAEGEAIAATYDSQDERLKAALDDLQTVVILNRLHLCIASLIARVSSLRRSGQRISPAELLEWRSHWPFSPEEAQIVAYFGDIDLTIIDPSCQVLPATISSLRMAGRRQRAALPDRTVIDAGSQN